MPEESDKLGFDPEALYIEQLKEIELSPLTIRGIFLLLTRLHWSDADHYGLMKPKMQNHVWSKGLNWDSQEKPTRGVYITYDYNYNPKDQSRRPAIFVGTSDIAFEKKVIDSSRGMSEDNAEEKYVTLSALSVIIRHIGKSADESLVMGDLSMSFFQGVRKMLQERLMVSSFDITELKTSRPFETSGSESNPDFIVDLIMPMRYNNAWRTIREGHILKTVTYSQAMSQFTETN